MNEQLDPAELAIDNCDREPIHRPGRVQPFGVLLAGPRDLSRVEYASDNTETVFEQPASKLLGVSFREILPRQVVHDLRNLISMSTSRAQRERVGCFSRDDRMIEVFVHRNPADQVIVEFEPVAAEAPSIENPIDRMRMLLTVASQQKDLTRFLRVCVVGLRELIGYDRVMAYRYAPNGDGEVVAEARSPQAESFLGLRYPAWDVPTQARALQVRNPVRMLSDVRQTPVPLLGLEQDPDKLDIALAHLRGISPIHVEYLQNMGVSATLTIGLVVEGKLWGMFSCHHMSPRVIRSDVRIAAELYGQMISLIIQQKLELEVSDARARAEKARRRVLADTDAATDLLSAFTDFAPILRDVIDADGLAIIRDDKVQATGSTPPTETIRAIAGREPDKADLVDQTDHLSDAAWAPDGDLGASAGCLQVRCTAATPVQALFFRDEKTRSVKWAGRPEKQVRTEPKGDVRLHPRGSFAAYLEEQAGRCEEWSVFDVEAAYELRKLLIQITGKDERAQLQRHKEMVTHRRQQDLMIAELNHRVKNILALVRSLSRQAKSSAASLESYAHALEQRISALATAHDLAVSDTMQGVSMRSILETELQPYLVENQAQVALAGPIVGLRADVAPMIALVFHEVVTNAAKYGALHTQEGVVQAKWSIDADGGLSFHWKELGGPPVTPPSRQGFGRSLIEKAIPYEFGGDVTLDYPPSGVTMTFRLPSDTLVDLANETEAKVVGPIGEIRTVAKDATALLVEDNVVLAMDMVDTLTRLGAGTVETANSAEAAMRAIRNQRFDFAVLDLNIRGTVTFDVANALRQRDVPFIFVTGYGSSIDIPADLSEVPVLSKPVDDGTLSQRLEALLDARG
ncbi:MAG: HWE histidine kinase domain-containing protein [Pseudomonadota bacterium]